MNIGSESEEGMLREVAVKQAAGRKYVLIHSFNQLHIFLNLVTAYFKELSWHLPGATVENHRKLQLGWWPGWDPNQVPPCLNQLACGFHLGFSGYKRIMQTSFWVERTSLSQQKFVLYSKDFLNAIQNMQIWHLYHHKWCQHMKICNSTSAPPPQSTSAHAKLCLHIVGMVSLWWQFNMR